MWGRLALAIVAGSACIALADAPPAISVEPTRHPAIPSDQGAQHATIRLDGEWRGTAPPYERRVTIPAELVGGTRRFRLRFEPAGDAIGVSWDDRALVARDGVCPLPVETTAGPHTLTVRGEKPPRAVSLAASGPVTIDDVTIAARPKGRRSADVVLTYTLSNRSSVDLIVDLVTTFAGPGLRQRHPSAMGATVALRAGGNRAVLRARLRDVQPSAAYAADTRVVFAVTSDRRLDRFGLAAAPPR
jgi:hypothetical protein